MKFGLLEFLTLIGAVGLFLYGMKLMSEGLQKAAGDKLRNILALMTNNRFVGAFTGIFITLPHSSHFLPIYEKKATFR